MCESGQAVCIVQANDKSQLKTGATMRLEPTRGDL
ncbi:MAG: hypothetical protein BMS9Abin14_066 [Gammaproteobacteria bacterium]|nr:MAG: hypothetical protein BMS9Abin14_066 [Gammaproteobacteria bacterium]